MITVLHHNDLDGHCSAAIVNHYYAEARQTERFGGIKMVSVNYDKPLPIDAVEEGIVWLVDFAPNDPEELLILAENCSTLFWFDHHKTTLEKYKDPIFKALQGVRTMGKPSACMLVWQWCFPLRVPPMAVAYTSDYDSWTWEYGGETKRFVQGMKTRDDSPHRGIWSALFAEELPVGKTLKAILDDGQIVETYEGRQNEAYLNAFGYDINWKEQHCRVVNRGRINSHFFASAVDNYDILIGYVHTPTGYMVLMYTTKESVDVGTLAKEMGGGGHKEAAGFTAKELPWE